jgi:hypothetical protein
MPFILAFSITGQIAGAVEMSGVHVALVCVSKPNIVLLLAQRVIGVSLWIV